MSLLLPIRCFSSGVGGVTPPVDPPDPGEMGQPDYAGSLLCQDDFTSAGGYNLANFSGPPGETAWPMGTTAPPPKGAFYGPHSSKVVVNPAGWLEGFFDKSATDIIVNYAGGNYAVRRFGHYISWNGQNNLAQMRSGVLVFKTQDPPKFPGMGRVLLPWPTDEKWPEHGEHDIRENYSGSSIWQGTAGVQGFEVNIHYGDGTKENRVWNRKINNVDLTQPHIYGFAFHAGDDAAGTNCYLAGFVDGVYKWGVKYNDLINYSYQNYTNNTSGSRTNRPATEIIPHGPNAVPMSFRDQTEAYGSTDAQYNGGRQIFKNFWYQAYLPLTLSQMQAKGYLLTDEAG